MDMDAKRRQQQQQQQQQLCVQALHHQTMNNHCAHAAPLGYLTSPWVMWDAGRVAETTRRRKRKKRLCTACLLAGVAVAILAVAGVAGLAVYLGGSPPTEGTTKWESFRRAGEPRQGEEVTTHRVHGKHGILLRAETPEKSTPPSRSPWSIRREEGVKWEGRGGGGGEAGASPEEIPHEDHLDYPYGSSEGIPEVEVVLEDGETDALGDRGADREESVTENQSARSPFARASEARRPLPLPSALLPDNTRNHFSLSQEDRESHLETTDAELTTSVDDLAAENADDEGRQDTGVQKRNQWNWSSDMEDEAGMYGVSSDEEVDTAEADEEEAEESEEDDQAVDGDKREEREGGEERRQHHPSNKLATEGIPVFNMLTKILKRLNSSSNSKEVDMPDTSNGTIECSPSQFRCAAPNEGIMCLPASSRCDGVRDCTLSGEDESGCTCADALRSRFLHRKLCDGVPDCWDYSDEDQCEWCTPGYMLCGGGARTCIEPKRICDGVKDCPGGDDESRCIALSSEEVDEEPKTMGLEARKVYQRGGIRSNTSRGLNYVTPSMVTNEVLPYRSSGYLLVRKKGVWGKLCLDGSEDKERRTRQDSSELNVAEIGYEVCKAMTHRDFEVVEQVTDDENFKNKSSTSLFSPYYQLQHGSINSEILGSMQGIHKTECSSKKVIRVKCKDLECGVRPKIKVNQWSRIVGGGNAAPGAWPWQAALYREGEFQCGATLISDHWLVSAGHCFFHARDDYWVARLGTLRRGTDLPSPHEQRRPVSSIILHAGYVDAGFLNDIALLRLSSPVEITDHVRPACLPPRALHISTPSTREIHVEQTTNNEEILYTYDEAVTTFSPMLNSDVGIKTEANTNIPYSKEELNYLKSNTPPKDMPFWEGTIEESDEYTSVHNERKTTSMPSNISDEPKQIIHLIREHHHNQSEGTHLKSTLSSMQSTKFNQSNVHYPNMNDQGADTHTITPTFLTNIDLPNKEFESVEYKMEMITLQPDKSETQGNEIRKNLNQGTESITMDDDSILLQHTSPQSITEYQKKKNLSSQVLSTHQSSNLRPINPDILTSNQNVIQTIDTRGKEEKDNLYLDESTKTTLPYNKQVEKTTKYVTVDIEMPTNNTNEIKEEFADFSVTKVTDSNKIISKVKVGQDTVFKQTSDAVNVTSENVMKTEQMQNNPKLLEERPDMPNILISDGKILLNKNNSDNYKMDSSIEYGAEKTDQENVKFASNYPMVTESITFIPDTKEPLLESIKLSIKDRKIRNVDEDDLDDGIRNGRLCTVVGWGQLFEVGRIFPDTLQEVELPLISTSECRKRTLYLPLYHLTDAMFCAGYDRGGRDACLGDSGGPLMCQEPDGHWSLYGVTSNGYGCARANRPGVYTKVSHYIPWMEEVMFQEDAYQEEWLKKGEREVKDEEGGEDGWKQRWEWRKRKGEEQGTGGKQYCPHRCPLGECLQRARVCNGVVDCSDASDEDNCQGETNMGR